MDARPLTVLTTRLPPQICGVGTFSWLLDRAWPGQNGLHEFLVVDGASESRSALHHSAISQFAGDWKSLQRLLDRIGASDLLLHYTGRGYHRLGCPVGLAGVLRRWKTKYPGARLITFFHELPGKLPITSRHYLPNLCNRGVVRKLAALTDVIVTNTSEHARIFEQSLRRPTHYLPVAANVEPPVNVQQERSPGEFVVFGLPYGRWQTLLAFHEYIQKWGANGALTRLHLIGPADPKFDSRSAALIRTYSRPDVVVTHGELSSNAISRLLLKARFALTTATRSNWSKSGTLMAYLAHGCVLVAKEKFDVEPLSFAVVPSDVGLLSDAELANRGGEARQWYETNLDWRILADKVSDLIQASPTDGI